MLHCVALAVWSAQSFASSRAENLPATHAVHSLSLVVVPAVISSPTPQLVTVEWATQAVDELLSSSQEVAPHSVQVVAAEVAAPGASLQLLKRLGSAGN